MEKKHLKMAPRAKTTILLFIVCFTVSLASGELPVERVKGIVERCKQDVRGPYRDIKWFCKDGSIIDSKARCPDGGNQHARIKEDVLQLAKQHHLYLTQILTGTDPMDFYDARHAQSRMKQYQLEQYLFVVDDGWINQRGKYYRGSKQVEDEMDWGRNFLIELLSDKQRTQRDYLLIRRAARQIPHGVDDKNTLLVRALSLEISDKMSSFMDIRTKIHGLPEPGDIRLVEAFYAKNEEKIKPNLKAKFTDLLDIMRIVYSNPDTSFINQYLRSIPAQNLLDSEVKKLKQMFAQKAPAKEMVYQMSYVLELIQQEITNMPKARGRLDLIDFSNLLEDRLIFSANAWQPATLQEALEKMCCLNSALKGGGYITPWEWAMTPEFTGNGEIKPEKLEYIAENYRRSLQWGTGMVYALYSEDVQKFAQFEPLAAGFNDDVIRSSPLLPMGATLDQIHRQLSESLGMNNQVFNLDNQGQIRGVNPGISKGILEVIDNFDEKPEVDSRKIYVFNRPPADLNPVAGILTVTEGNAVSHVQLLARNLGIPNAVISLENLKDLKKYIGKEVFYAVSPKGKVVMKAASDMNKTEKQLFEQKTRKSDRIAIPLDKLDLSVRNVVNMATIDGSYSGKICGPKAANLAQLKKIFPDHVVEGLVLPFGLYRAHLDQKMPVSNQTYWEFVNEILYGLKAISEAGVASEDFEARLISDLDKLRAAIKSMPLLPEFEKELKRSFNEVFNSPMGSVPVFIRSDTNMEDLKEFTGAGLNLTLFNIRDADKIWKGIKEVWASPFSERSYKWRQNYLENPENVYPSILIIPSVNVDKSGVIITQGLAVNRPFDMTVAFSQGAGGAVDGLAAETWLLFPEKGQILLSPSRETIYKSIPPEGGTVEVIKEAGKNTLNSNDLRSLREMAENVKRRMPEFGMEGPYDIELGIKDGKVWLFQIRPFVENKNALSSTYLQSLSPKVKAGTMIDLEKKIEF